MFTYPSALNAGAKRSYASMLLLGEGSEATEPYNKYEPLQIKSSSMHIGCNNTHFVLFWKSDVLSRFENQLFCLVLNIGCFVSF